MILSRFVADNKTLWLEPLAWICILRSRHIYLYFHLHEPKRQALQRSLELLQATLYTSSSKIYCNWSRLCHDGNACHINEIKTNDHDLGQEDPGQEEIIWHHQPYPSPTNQKKKPGAMTPHPVNNLLTSNTEQNRRTTCKCTDILSNQLSLFTIIWSSHLTGCSISKIDKTSKTANH